MNWVIRKVVDGYRALAQRVYDRRYGTIARQLGRDEVAAPGRDEPARGFIVIQVDGLAHDHLVQAMARDTAPYIKRLLGGGRLRLASWHCGLPSTTPAVQAGIMYGHNWDIPGFRWYEKALQRAVVCRFPPTLQAIKARIADGRSGILSEGSSYFNMFDGDAEWSVFTLSSLRAPRFFAGVRGLGLTLLFLLSPLRIWRIIRLSIWYYLLDVGRRLASLFRPSDYRPFDLISPMTSILVRVLFQEIITFGVQLDIYRGARAIYLTNVAYDEVAHHFGPSHAASFRAIKSIDRQVAQIDKMLNRYGQRTYDLYILSDHGMSPSVPFKQRFGQTLGDYILQQVDRPLVVDERWEAPIYDGTQAQYLLDELHGLEEILSPRGASVVRAASAYVSRSVSSDGVTELRALSAAEGEHGIDHLDRWDLDRHSDIAVRVSGPLAHVYFNVSTQRLDLSDIAVLYPALLTRLIDHPGIGLVVGRENNETIMLGKEGRLSSSEAKDVHPESNPLAGMSDPPMQAARIEHVASMPRAGDLMLLGTRESGAVVTFEDQVGTHGGLGGPQSTPFILYPANIELPAGTLNNACDLYPVFARYLRKAPDSFHTDSDVGGVR